MEDRLRRWLVPAIAAALVLTGIVVVASAMRLNGLNSGVAPLQEKEKLQSEGREKLEREIKELTEGLQKETNPEVREKLSRMLRERQRQLEGERSTTLFERIEAPD